MSERIGAGTHVVEPEPPPFAHRGMPTLTARSSEWAPEIDARLARVGTRIWIVADVVFFAAWFFAFFYLRALNNDYSWPPAGSTHPTSGIGALIALLLILSAAFYWAGARAVAAQPSTGRLFFWLAL